MEPIRKNIINDINEFLELNFYSGVKYRDLTKSCDLSKGNCDDVSEDLKKYLSKIGYTDLELVYLYGSKFNLDQSHEEWKSHWGENNYHTILRVGDVYVDLTGSQFSPEQSGIKIYTLQELSNLWTSYETKNSNGRKEFIRAINEMNIRKIIREELYNLKF
jgi:hypothetical protein